MTQEELDALLAGGLDDLDDNDNQSCEEAADDEIISENSKPSEELNDDDFSENEEIDFDEEYKSYRPDSKKSWPPPPPTDDHKVVNQLDDVTRDSEVKANEMLEKIEAMMDYFAQGESAANELKNTLQAQVDLFSILSEKFPNVKSFHEALDAANKGIKKLNELNDTLAMGQDEAMMAMDAMQYQDIHRQKIERVINVMRALSRYMNSLFEGRIDDERRTSSAVHIEGDSTTDVVSNDDIEALIASLGAK